MAINLEYVGRKYPPSRPYEVSREKIREFATSIGDDNPAYHSRTDAQALGHPDVVAPPTFPVVITMLIGQDIVADPELGLDYSRVVHGEQQFVHHRPIRAGDVIVATPLIEDIRTRAGNDFFTWSAEIATADGEPVCRVVTTLVARGRE
jgi:acyl dehydratase